MCGRYTLHHTTQEVAERFAVQQVLFPLEPRYNIAPGQAVPVVKNAEEKGAEGLRWLEGMKWGLVPFWAKDPAIGNRMINARAEGLGEKPAFKNALKRRRCLIPTDGFYEWQKAEKTSARPTGKQPMHIRPQDEEIFAFAGLWDEWQAPDGSPLRTCTIITTRPNEFMANIHDRMPVILPRELEDDWLDSSLTDADELINFLQPLGRGMQAHPVSLAVNTPAFDAPTCIASITDDDEASEQTAMEF